MLLNASGTKPCVFTSKPLRWACAAYKIQNQKMPALCMDQWLPTGYRRYLGHSEFRELPAWNTAGHFWKRSGKTSGPRKRQDGEILEFSPSIDQGVEGGKGGWSGDRGLAGDWHKHRGRLFKCRERFRGVINHFWGLSRKQLAESFGSNQMQESPLVFPHVNAAPRPAPRAPRTARTSTAVLAQVKGSFRSRAPKPVQLT